GDDPKARDYLLRSLPYDESSGGNGWKLTRHLGWIGYTHYDQKNYKDALPYAERAAAIADQTGSPELLYRAQDLLGLTQLGLGNNAAARQSFQKEIAAFEAIRSHAAGTDQDRQHLPDIWMSAWSGMVQVLVRENQPE